MTDTIQRTQALTTEVCCSCGVLFAMPTRLHEQCLRNPNVKNFYCPNGHAQVFTGKTDAEKERERADRLARQLASREEDLRVERLSHSATRGHLTRVKKRAEAALCPHCNRTFVQLKRHLETKHPQTVHS